MGLLPDKNLWWACLVEDITTSDWWRGMRAELLNTCVAHGEFSHVTMDATVRILRRVIGQADYRASGAVKAEQAIPEADAKRRLLSIRGITGAVACLALVRDESCQELRSAIQKELSEAIRTQVVSLACDNASAALRAELQTVLPHLKYLLLDCTHLAIHYHQAQWQKTRPGELYLRKLLRKFVQVDSTKESNFWGPPYCGEGEREHNQQEKRYRCMVESGAMRLAEARGIHERLDDTTPFYNRLEVLTAMASLSALHWPEVNKKTQVQGVKLHTLLWRAMAPHKMEWYFNNTRMMHSLPSDMLKLVANGSTSNESLNHEINAASKNQPTPRHLDSVAGQMQIFHLGKLLSHNCALYFPTTSLMRPADVLAARVTSLKIPPPAWEAWCAKNALRYTSFALVRKRLAISKALRNRGQSVRKPMNKAKKRTPFSLVRSKRTA